MVMSRCGLWRQPMRIVRLAFVTAQHPSVGDVPSTTGYPCDGDPLPYHSLGHSSICVQKMYTSLTHHY